MSYISFASVTSWSVTHGTHSAFSNVNDKVFKIQGTDFTVNLEEYYHYGEKINVTVILSQ